MAVRFCVEIYMFRGIDSYLYSRSTRIHIRYNYANFSLNGRDLIRHVYHCTYIAVKGHLNLHSPFFRIINIPIAVYSGSIYFNCDKRNHGKSLPEYRHRQGSCRFTFQIVVINYM